MERFINFATTRAIYFQLVPSVSLELTRLSTLDPKSSVSPNSTTKALLWSGKRDSNSHAYRHQILSLACLPIPSFPEKSCPGDFHLKRGRHILAACIRLTAELLQSWFPPVR